MPTPLLLHLPAHASLPAHAALPWSARLSRPPFRPGAHTVGDVPHAAPIQL